MRKEARAIDISHVPELLRLAEEVKVSGEPRILRRDSEELAVLMPAKVGSRRGARRVRTKADRQAFLSSAGSWKGIVDVDRLIADI